MRLMKIRKDGNVGWMVQPDEVAKVCMDVLVDLGHAVHMVQLDDSDTPRFIDPDLLPFLETE